MLVDEVVERCKVPGFLVVHVRHERSEVGVLADDERRLRFVDERGGQFAGLVDAELTGFRQL